MKIPWIKTADRPPRVMKGSRYHGPDGIYGAEFLPVLFVHDGRVCAGRYFGPAGGYYSLQGYHHKANDVTHWQVMPDPPED